MGTLAIIGLAAVLGLGVGVADSALRHGRTGWWRLTVVPGLILFLSPGMVWAPAFLLGGPAFGVRGRVLRALGALVLLGTVALGLVMVLFVPDPGAEKPSFGDVVVFEAGFAALAVLLAWAGSLVWQPRRQPSSADRSAPMVVSAP